MSQKKPNKILICRYKQPLVESIGSFESIYMREAKQTCLDWNDRILKKYGSDDLDHEFWFLNCQIKGRTTIITASSKRDYPENDAEIMEKLAEYLASLVPKEGSAKNRGGKNSRDRE